MSKIGAVVLGAVLLSGCTTTPNTDGSTTVSLSVPGLSKLRQATTPNREVTHAQMQQSGGTEIAKVERAPVGTPIGETELAGIFSEQPWDGSTDTYYPKVAITVTDTSRSDCWVADAVVWRSSSKSESVEDVSVCANNSLGAALHGAASVHIFMEQSQLMDHTGNKRTTGPKPPRFAIPMSEPTPEGFVEFVQQLVKVTGWEAGPAEVTMWIVDFQ